MKKAYLAPYSLFLIVANCVAALLFARIAEDVREAYKQMLGGMQVVPGITLLALGFPRWFWLLGALSLLSSIGLFVRKAPLPVLMHSLLIIAILDGVVLFLFALGIGLYFVPPLEKIGL